MEVELDLTRRMVERLLAGTCDIVLLAGPVASPGVRTAPIGSLDLVWVANPAVARNHAAGTLPGVWSLPVQSPLHGETMAALDALPRAPRSVSTCNNVRTLIDVIVRGAGGRRPAGNDDPGGTGLRGIGRSAAPPSAAHPLRSGHPRSRAGAAGAGTIPPRQRAAGRSGGLWAERQKNHRHPRESGEPSPFGAISIGIRWVPAFARMTTIFLKLQSVVKIAPKSSPPLPLSTKAS
ncbi:LysR substrate-binding domain-containing protein [Novosphingobium colocasiae]